MFFMTRIIKKFVFDSISHKLFVQGIAFFVLALASLLVTLFLFSILGFVLYNGLWLKTTNNYSTVPLAFESHFIVKEKKLWAMRHQSIALDSIQWPDLQQIYINRTLSWGSFSDQSLEMNPLLTKSNLWPTILQTDKRKSFQSGIKFFPDEKTLFVELEKTPGSIALLENDPKDHPLLLHVYTMQAWTNIHNPARNIPVRVDSWQEQIPQRQSTEAWLWPEMPAEALLFFGPDKNLWDSWRHYSPLFLKAPWTSSYQEAQAFLNQNPYHLVISPFWAEEQLEAFPLHFSKDVYSFGLSPNFLLTNPSESAKEGGILSFMMNTLYVMIYTAFFAIPLGVGSALFLVFYVRNQRLYYLLSLSVETLSSIPAILFGLFGLAIFVPFLGFGLLSGGLASALMIVPTLIKVSEDGLRAVPKSLYFASMALGASKARSIIQAVLPSAAGHILTGIILSLGRAFGEAAVLMFTLGTSLSAISSPFDLHSSGRNLSVHLYSALGEGIIHKAYPTAALLVIFVFIFNSLAHFIRRRFYYKFQRG